MHKVSANGDPGWTGQMDKENNIFAKRCDFIWAQSKLEDATCDRYEHYYIYNKSRND